MGDGQLLYSDNAQWLDTSDETQGARGEDENGDKRHRSHSKDVTLCSKGEFELHANVHV